MTRFAQKELRTLAVPAALVLAATLAGAAGSGAWLPQVGRHSFSNLFSTMFLLAFLVGTPLIAATPFGSEFRSRTMTLLLAQPIARRRIWATKWIASLGLLAAVGGLQLAVSAPILLRAGLDGSSVFAGATYVVMVACSAPLWTLVAGSTTGGLALTPAAILWLEMSAFYGWTHLGGHSTGWHEYVFAPAPAIVAVRMAYCGATAWLGWRRFAAYQTAGSRSVSLSAGTGSAGWAFLRARRGSPIANLVRKELTMLRPLYMVAGAFVASWIAARLVVVPGTPVGEVLSVVILAVYMAIAVVLAATMSSGEEASLGVRAWHLTLPVSARTQWAIKLAVSLGAAFVFVLVLPALVWGAAPLGDARIPWTAFLRPWNVALAAGAVILAFWGVTLVADIVTATVSSACVLLGLLVLMVVAMRWSTDVVAGTRVVRYGLLATAAVFLPAVATALAQSANAFGRIQVPRATAVRMSLVLLAVSAASAGTFVVLARWIAAGQ